MLTLILGNLTVEESSMMTIRLHQSPENHAEDNLDFNDESIGHGINERSNQNEED